MVTKALFLAALLLAGCAANVEQTSDVPAFCLAHDAGDFLASTPLACDHGPDCGFTATNVHVPITPDYPVEFVCHCVGGQYACFGHP